MTAGVEMKDRGTGAKTGSLKIPDENSRGILASLYYDPFATVRAPRGMRELVGSVDASSTGGFPLTLVVELQTVEPYVRTKRSRF